MKQILEFDETQQSPELTLSQLKVSIDAFILTTGIKSLQVHEVRRTKSRTLAEAFLTWGNGELTDAQMQTLTAILHSQPGLVGYTPPIPGPLVLPVGLFSGAGGLASNSAIPYLASYDTGLECYYAGPYGANSGSTAGYLRAGAGGNVYSYVQPNPFGYIHTSLMFFMARPSAAAVTLLPKAATFTLKDADENVITLAPRAKDIVITPSTPPPWDPSRYSGMLAFYIAADGKLYLSAANDAVVANPVSGYWDDVCQGPAW